ncbi:MAG: peptidoglycan editing factor PgeF, partial [Bacteroidales bacterium]|nr:peptidoglycan editing factor PgeF [Bacteroidales bacterium]
MNGLQFNIFKSYTEISHLISTRQGGVSPGNYNSLNLSYQSGDISHGVAKNRNLIAKKFNIASNKLILPEQKHTNNICIVDENNFTHPFHATDALITATPGICIGVLAADCVPILFYDTKNKIVAAVHAGWRGSVELIAPLTVDKLNTEFKSDPKHMLVGIGPCISEKNYEVGLDVFESCNQKIPNAQRYFTKNTNKKFQMNISHLNYSLLTDCSIPPGNIELMNICTYDNKELFFSARRDDFHSG